MPRFRAADGRARTVGAGAAEHGWARGGRVSLRLPLETSLARYLPRIHLCRTSQANRRCRHLDRHNIGLVGSGLSSTATGCAAAAATGNQGVWQGVDVWVSACLCSSIWDPPIYPPRRTAAAGLSLEARSLLAVVRAHICNGYPSSWSLLCFSRPASVGRRPVGALPRTAWDLGGERAARDRLKLLLLRKRGPEESGQGEWARERARARERERQRTN